MKSNRWTVVPETGCWQWNLDTDKDGYGITWFERRATKAHRWSYERHVAPIAQGLVLDHLCNNRACINPEHLEPVTHAENMRRAALRRTHCGNGHEFTPENTRIIQTIRSDRAHLTTRRCRVCDRAAAARYYQKRKATAHV
jgi:hypothetical protein